MSIGLLI